MAGPDDVTHLALAGTPGGRTDWLSAAAAVVRKSGRMQPAVADEQVLQLLGGLDFEGLPIPALGTPDLSAGLPASGVPGQVPYLRGSRLQNQGWDVRSYIADSDPGSANAAALADLDGGVNSLWIRVGGSGTRPKELSDVLENVYLDLAPVILYPAGEASEVEISAGFGSVLDRRGIQAHPDSNLGADPVGRFVRSGDDRGALPLQLEKPVRRTGVRAVELGVKGFVVDGTVAHERGAGAAAELGWSLAVGVAYLRELATLGLDLTKSLGLIEFRYAATDDQFATIAKFRAARLLWDRVAELSGAGDRPGQVQHGATSRSMMTRYDPWTNLLRTTLAAFAAGVGGAQSITAMPFDSALGIPDALGRRLARNISHLLISESHVAAAADPAGGAHAVETLTWQLAEAGWAEFQQIEAAGSIVDAVHDGSLKRRWAQAAALREHDIVTRRQPITGVSEFPLAHEKLPTRRPDAPDVDGDRFHSPWAGPYESMRDHPVVGSVFLATIGPLARHSARAAFIRNAFAAGGIDTVEAGATGGVTDVLARYRAAGIPEVVCIAGSDGGYAELGPDLVYGLRAVGAERIVLAGKPSAALAELIDDHLASGEDVVQFLLRTRHAMGFPDKPTHEPETR